jgi:SAM-dependent methyltransferase
MDWDEIAKDYHRHILSPFAPEMLEGLDAGTSRNALMNALAKLGVFETMDVLDLGCGPGNFLRALQRHPHSVTGVDLSGQALQIAAATAQELNIRFTPVQADITRLALDKRFDLVVSVNSILPGTRAEVLDILKGIRNVLKPNGLVHAILPSFDTTEYLGSLWFEHFRQILGNDNYAEQCIMHLDSHKRVDRQRLLYADDGVNQQAYHTQESIFDEFAQAGLVLITPPQKIYYPWALTRRFDYGYFPNAPEEIWDWYVYAKSVVGC